MAANQINATNLRNSRRVKATLVTENLKPNDHPLHLFVSRRNAKLFNVSDTDTGFFLSLWTNTKCLPTPSTSHPAVPGQGSIFQRMLSNSQNFPEILFPFPNDNKVEKIDVVTGIDMEIFVQVWVREMDGKLPSDTIVLTCNTKFLTHYNIQSHDVYVRPVKVFPVSRAVLGVSSPEAFQWLTRYDFCKRMLAIVETNKVLIRTKDVFLSPYGDFFEKDPDFKRQFCFDIYVLECLPVQQGIITKSTEIVLTFLEDLAIEKEKEQKDLESLKVNSRRGISGPFNKDILLSEFSFALRQNYLSTPEILDLPEQTFRDKAKVMNSIKLRNRKPSEIVGKFEYDVVSQESIFRRILWRDSKKIGFDPMYFVGMSRKQMIKEGLFDGSIVVIFPQYQDNDYDDDKPKCITEKICMVRCLGKEFDRSRKLFISPLCLFNILRMPPIEMPIYLIMKRYDTGKVDDDCSSRSGKECLPVAMEVCISIIPSPNYSPRAPHDEALKQYFTCSRVVAKGDAIAIRSCDDPMFWQNTGDDTENRFPCIYFKVVNIRAEDLSHQNYVTDINTTLIQIGSEHSYIPVMMQTYLSPNEQGFWDKNHLPGLTSYVQKLENYILPHITAKPGSKILQSVPPAILVTGPVGCGKTTLVVTVARRLGVHCYKVNCHSLVGDSSGTTEERLKKGFNAAGLYSPCILLLQSVHALGRDRDANNEDPRIASSFFSNVAQLKNDLQQFPMILVATTHSEKYLSQDMLDCFLHEVTIQAPTEIERSEIVDSLLHTINCSGNISISYIAQRTAGFVLGDLAALAAHAKREAFKRIVKMCSGNSRPDVIEEEDLVAAGVVEQQADFQTALDQLQAAHSDAIGAAKIPNVRWDDIGGLMNVKRDILDTIQLPLQYPELLAAGLRRSGVLLYGPPGTGKTLLAKAVATECSLNFLSVKGPELINMYVGQSEQNIREVFQRARSAAPCVIFFDELDSLAPNRGRSGDSGGVMDRLVSQLLAELDGLNKACDVFVIGATNRPDLLDSALLRPGRFDKILYLGVSEDHQSQLRILTALTRKFNIAEGFNMEAFVEKCPFTLTGADFYALASDAMLNALKKKIKRLEEGESVDQTMIVNEDDFNEALDNLSPSVSEQELERYKQLREQFHVKKNALTSVTSKLFEIADVYDEQLSNNFSSVTQPQDSVSDSC